MSRSIRRLAVGGLCLAAGLAGTVLASPAAQAAPPLSGKQLVSASSAHTAGSSKLVQATCPAGKVVISGGAFVAGPSHVQLTELQPVPTGNLFQVSARNTWGRDRWTLSAFAVCANRPAGYQIVPGTSQPSPSQSRIAVAICPAGKQVIGIGGKAATEAGRNVALTVVVPPGNVTTAWVKSSAAQGGEPQNWTTKAYAVCADNLGAYTQWVPGTADSSSPKWNSASCLPGKLSAIGGLNGADSGQVAINSLYPDAALTQGAVLMSEDHDGFPGSWAVEAWAICA